MNKNLSGSPLQEAFSQNFHFFNCSSNITFQFMEPITCLSTSNYSVFAVPSRGYMFSTCNFIKTVTVPIPTPNWEFYEYGYRPEIHEDLHLVWYTPNCLECVQRGGKCGFKNSKSSDIRCFDLPRRVVSKGSEVCSKHRSWDTYPYVCHFDSMLYLWKVQVL
ncbi:hypothetical protein AQUCO_03700157v1 [Aquilegia coerulea]|uniref:RING-type E3 ubiquitin transferase n=1 Tax=Aquilegia coerulea TaxID=218851 RepID=A0A2G5CTT8_AQUCA|nr:hypothetical protein AQUCO_03700157v1 [Aquilegia coerulea]